MPPADFRPAFPAGEISARRFDAYTLLFHRDHAPFGPAVIDDIILQFICRIVKALGASGGFCGASGQFSDRRWLIFLLKFAFLYRYTYSLIAIRRLI